MRGYGFFYFLKVCDMNVFDISESPINFHPFQAHVTNRILRSGISLAAIMVAASVMVMSNGAAAQTALDDEFIKIIGGSGAAVLPPHPGLTQLGAIAIGSGAAVNYAGGIAIGRGAQALGGAYASSYSVALGDGAIANTDAREQAGITVIGGAANAMGSARATLLGALSKVSSDGGVALGYGAVVDAGIARAVAVGTDSVASAANTVSFGTVTAGRRLVNVTAGTDATDAVVISQLTPVVTALGGSAAFNATTGGVTGPSYTLTRANTLTGTSDARVTVGDALNRVDAALGVLDTRSGTNATNIATNTTNITNITGGTVGLVQRTTTAGRAVLTASGGSGATPGAAQVLGNVAKGTLSTSSTDAVNASQLFDTGTSTATQLGGGATYSAATGTITGLSYTLANANTLSGATGAVTSVGNALSRVDSAFGGVNTRVTTNATNITNLSGGTVGLVQRTATANRAVLTASGGTGAAPGTAQVLGNLANGALSVTSTDAVNGSQLFDTGTSTATQLGGGATYSAATGTITGLSYTLANANTLSGTTGAVTSVGNALSRVDSALGGVSTRVTTNTTNITNLSGGTVGLVQRTATANRAVLTASGGTGTTPGAAQVLSNIANGAITITSTDAINGSQLQGFGTNTAALFGGGAAFTNGAWSAPSYAIQSSTYNNVGAALGAVNSNLTTINNSITNITSGSSGLVQQSAAGANLTVGKGTDGTAVDFTGTDGTDTFSRKLIGITAGTAATDAVNVSQLTPVVTALGGGAAISATGAVTAPTYQLSRANTINGVTGNYATVGAALTNIDNALGNLGGGLVGPVQRGTANQLVFVASGGSAATPGTAQVLTNVGSGAVTATSRDAVNGAQLSGLGSNTATALGGGASFTGGTWTAPSYSLNGGTTTVNNVGAAVTNLDGRVTSNAAAITNISNGTTGVIQRTATSNRVTLTASGGTGAVPGAAQVLTNLAAGALTATSTDAVNGSQLYGTGNSLAALIGGGATFDAVTGVIARPVQQLLKATGIVGNAGSTGTLSGSLSHIDNALGVLDTNITNLTTSLNDGTVGLVQQAASGANLTVGKDTDGTAIDFTGSAGSRKLAGVEDGAVSAASSEAVNGSQLHGVATSISTAIGGGVTVNTDGTVTQPAFTIGGTSYNSISNAFGAVNTSITSILDGSTPVPVKYLHINSTLADGSAGGQESIAIGGAATSGGVRSVALGSNAVSSGSGALAIGAGAVASQAGSIAIGENSVADRVASPSSGAITINGGKGNVAIAYDTTDRKLAGAVSVGGNNTYRQITNVADGQSDFDAVNVRQLQSGLGSVSNYVSQVDSKVDALGTRVTAIEQQVVRGNAVILRQLERTEGRLSGGIAATAAMGAIPFIDPGKTYVGASVATYNGEGGIGAVIAHRSEDGSVVIHAGVGAGSGGSRAVARLGVGYQF